MINDYFLVAALPILFIALGLLQSILSALFEIEKSSIFIAQVLQPRLPGTTPRLTAAVELLWVTIYCVKFCFLAQFRFHKPPYAYVNVHLTRYYWSTIGICAAAFLITIAEPIVLCSTSKNCRYADQSSNVAWETAVSVIDIITDLLVISIQILLIHMANFTRSDTIINCTFKSLSIFAIVIAATRLGLQYDSQARRINYVSFTFLLAIEAAIAIIMASISSHRVVLLNWLEEHRTRKAANVSRPRMHKRWRTSQGLDNAMEPSATRDISLSSLPIQAPVANTPGSSTL
ncbi:hypothetical protein CC80DRAFT_412196 [Byssothecium circinans]|uniref:Integral membrane protein n=1 Tax=Byssothecium circinans TaxID=147558 RepID=A0A6A5TW41_9PLEO|nr:hypothetical protein CC80DRAFT_412196 [Byssothecium circinans]